MDGLNDQQRALAWLSTRDPSFDGVAIIRPDGIIQSANLQFYEILKSTPAEIEGLHWADLFQYPSKDLLQKNVKRVMEGIDPKHRNKAVITTPSGQRIAVAIIFTATFRADGKLDFGIKKIIETQEHQSSSASPKKSFLKMALEWKEALAMAVALVGGAFYTAIKIWQDAQ